MKKELSAGILQKRFRTVFITLLVGGFLSFIPYHFISLPSSEVALALQSADASTAYTALPLYYTFNSAGSLSEASTASNSTSKYFWLSRGAKLSIDGSVGMTIQGDLPLSDSWRTTYASRSSVSTDNGAHPQNLFLMFSRASVQNTSAQIYIKRTADNLSNTANRQPYNGEMLLARYQDVNNYYYGGVRADGGVVLKKKTNGVYQTLASKQLLSGTYNSATNPDLIPLNKWIGLKLVVVDTTSGPQLSLYTDVGQTGTWQLALTALDDASKFGSPISAAGPVGIESDYADAQFDNFLLADATPVVVPVVVTPAPVATSTPVSTPVATTYDSAVSADSPVMYLTMGSPSSSNERDQTGNGHNGSYKGGAPSSATLPNGDIAADFNGTSQYLTVPSSSDLSIPTTKKLTWEAWIRPGTLDFPVASGDGYIDWMGKCENYSPNCEWEARMYNSATLEGRPDRLSAYVFNPSAGLGSAADWQPDTGVVQAGKWIHVVAEYQTVTTPSGCSTAYPGSIDIWVNGVKQDASSHFPTGCMSQYSIKPTAGDSPLDIGTMAFDTWFKGAVGKVAVYNYLLSQTQINSHFQAMTGNTPSGSCGQTCTTP